MGNRIEWSAVRVVAAKEMRDRIRNRWVLVIGLVFALFALAIAQFGSVEQGAVGFRSADVALASLVSLVVYLVPLIALVLGYDAVVGERERGSLELLLSMPLSAGELLLGKYLGLALALAVSTVAGFGASLLPLLGQLGAADFLHFGIFMGSAVLMGLAFLSLAVMVSVLSPDRVRASGLAIALWFFFVLVFDMLLMGGLVLGQGRVGSTVFGTLLMLNPADVFRLMNIAASEQMQGMYGLATVVAQPLMRAPVLAAILLAWAGLPLLIAKWRFR